MLPLMLVLGCSALLPEVSGHLVGAKIPAIGFIIQRNDLQVATTAEKV